MNNQELAKILGIDKKGEQKITFVKTNFHPEKIGAVPVFNRMFYNANFKSELIRINNDIKTAFTNLIKIGVHRNEIPMLSSTLFNQLMITIDSGNKEFIADDSAPEFTRKELRKISDIQYKIYKVLFKIEADLIDEQDTRIKDNNEDLLEKIRKLLDERDAKLKADILKEIEGKYGSGGSGGGRDRGLIGTLYYWYKLAMMGWDLFKFGRWLYNKAKWLRQSRAQNLRDEIERQRRVQEEARKKMNEAEERMRKAEDKLARSGTDADRAKIEADRAAREAKQLEAEAEKAGKQGKQGKPGKPGAPGKPSTPGKPVPSPNASSLPETRAGRPPSQAAKRFPKLAKAFSTFAKAAGPLLGKAMIALDIFILLPMRICDFWELSMKPGDEGHLEFNFIERCAYSIAAGLTQWVEDHLRLVEDLAKLFKLIIDFFAENFASIAGDGGGVFGLFADIASNLSFGVGKLLELVITPLTDELIKVIKENTGAATGDKAGMCAVMLVNDIWDELTALVRGSVPNEMTYQLLTGENTVMNELQRKGIYTWNKFGESELKYKNVSDIATKLTKSEIMTILAHDDVSVSLRRTLKDALKYKEEKGITDTDVYKSIYVNPYIDSLITVLNSSSAALEEQWLKMIQGAVDQTQKYLIRFGWASVEYDSEKEELKVLNRGPFADDNSVEYMFKCIFSRFKGQCALLGIWTIKYETLYFDIFGTLMNSGFSSIPVKNVINPADSKQYLKVLGYIDKQRQFHEGKACPNDEIFEEVLKKNNRGTGGIYSDNIIVDEVVSSKTPETISQSDIAGVSLPSHLAMTNAGVIDEPAPSSTNATKAAGSLAAMGSSLPSHLASTTGYSDTDFSVTSTSAGSGSSGGSGGSSLPSYLAGTFTPGLTDTAETQSLSGTEQIPDLNNPGYTGTDYTSVEAIKKARVYQKGGKWYSDNPFVDAIIQIESMRNASARPYSKKQKKYLSSAAGLFQFLKGTGEKFGLMTLQDRMNPYKSLEAFKRYVLENMNALKRNGIPVTPANLYLSHQQGAAGFNQIYKYITGKSRSLSGDLRGLMAGNTHGHRYTSPQDWYRNWVNDIAKLMGQTPQMPAVTDQTEQVESYSAGSSSPGDYSGSQGSSGSSGLSGAAMGSLGSSGSSGSSGISAPVGYASSSGSVLGQKAPEGAPSYVQSSYSLMQKNTGGNGMAAAARYARQHAKKKSIGYCAKFVANALQHAGVKFTRQPSAYMYHTKGILKQAGFGLVSVGRRGYSPEVGDVCVINRFNKHKHGHICIWDGQNWISDFVQRNPSPYSDGPGESGIFFYRYGGEDLQVDESFMGDDSYPATNSESYSDNSMSSPKNTSTGDKSISMKKKGMPEYEGEAETLFTIKLGTILND